jgi:NAD(P)-dependent dehydrogenase (short-subunit alcohol dehydrogenase family)
MLGQLPPDAGPALRAACGLPGPDPDLGVTVHANTPAELVRRAQDLLAGSGPTAPLPRNRAERAPEAAGGKFTGEVALVTGAASGIGRAAAQSLLERGAAVVGLDLKPDIARSGEGPAYLGLQVDLTDEGATLEALETAVRHFGGLDMLVLNAGMFPPSCNLEALTLDHWRDVMRVNVDVNVTLLREAYPLLKRAPRYGRVVINASRNVPAPGPGAAAYSASKAALAQLGRVAALEWAASGIRVNMVNPHAVFDTGLWTDEVLRSRAAKYGITVEQYKTNNLLHVELTSRDLGELVAELMGPLFAKTTGAQIPVDGGSDRVI